MTKSSLSDTQRLLVLTKAPVLGAVKTRLQPQFSRQQSLLIHRRLVQHCLMTVASQSFAAVELWVSDDHPWWRELELRYSMSVHQQRGQSLGERMCYAAKQALTRSDHVVIIGTDCPFIDVDYLRGAYTQLQGNTDIVLGPAQDGGYVLIGLRRLYAEIFDQIDWGTDQVLQQTRAKMKALSLVWAELSTLRDVDRADDVRHLKQAMPRLHGGSILNLQ